MMQFLFLRLYRLDSFVNFYHFYDSDSDDFDSDSSFIVGVIIILFNSGQLVNILFPIEVTNDGIVICVNDEHLKKTEFLF